MYAARFVKKDYILGYTKKQKIGIHGFFFDFFETPNYYSLFIYLRDICVKNYQLFWIVGGSVAISPSNHLFFLLSYT